MCSSDLIAERHDSTTGRGEHQAAHHQHEQRDQPHLAVAGARHQQIAQALGVDIGYFFEEIEPERAGKAKPAEMMPQQRMLLELARNFASINNRRFQDAICNLARVLAANDKEA